MKKARSTWLWLAILPGVLLLTLGIAFLALWIGFDASSYQDVLLRQLSGRLGRPVRVEDVEVGFVPPRLRLLGVEVGEISTAADETLFTARSLDADFNLGAMFGNEPAVRRFQVVESTIYLRQDPSGKWNFLPGPDLSTDSKEQRPGEGSLMPPVRDWYLHEGTVLVEPYGQDPIRLANLEAAVTDISTEDPFPVRIQFQLEPAGSVEVDGRLGPFPAEGSLGQLRMVLSGIAPADLALVPGLAALPASASQVSGSLELALLEESSRVEGAFDLQLAEDQKLAPLGEWNPNGSASFSDLRCRLAEQADPIGIGSLRISFQEDRIEATAEGVALGEKEYRFAGELKSFQTPHISFHWSGDRLDWTTLKSHLTSPTGRSGSSRSRDIHSTVLRSARGKGDLDLARLEKGELSLGPISSDVVLNAGTIRLRPIEMALHDGRASGGLLLKTARGPLSIDMQAELDDIDLNQLLSAHTSYPDTVYGKLTGSLRVQARASEKGFVRSSEGHARVEVTGGPPDWGQSQPGTRPAQSGPWLTSSKKRHSHRSEVGPRSAFGEAG